MKPKHLFVCLLLVILIFLIGAEPMRTPITKPGFDNIPSVVTIYDTATTVINNAAEATLCEVTIPRNTLGLTDRIVHMQIQYLAENSTGSATSIVWRAYYGSSAAVATGSDGWSSSATPRHGIFSVWLMNMGAVNDQQLILKDEKESHVGNYDRIAQNSNEDLTLKVTVDFNVASSSLFIRNFVCIVTQYAP